jgi:hypothetical protein
LQASEEHQPGAEDRIARPDGKGAVIKRQIAKSKGAADNRAAIRLEGAPVAGVLARGDDPVYVADPSAGSEQAASAKAIDR